MTGCISFFNCIALINSVWIPDLLSCLLCKLPISGLQKNRGLTLEKTPDFANVIVSGASRRYHFPNSRLSDCHSAQGPEEKEPKGSHSPRAS